MEFSVLMVRKLSALLLTSGAQVRKKERARALNLPTEYDPTFAPSILWTQIGKGNARSIPDVGRTEPRRLTASLVNPDIVTIFASWISPFYEWDRISYRKPALFDGNKHSMFSLVSQNRNNPWRWLVSYCAICVLISPFSFFSSLRSLPFRCGKVWAKHPWSISFFQAGTHLQLPCDWWSEARMDRPN